MLKKWEVLPDPPQSFFEEFPELPKTVASLLYHRNIKTQKQIDEFLNPDYSEDIHDPFLFKDMEKTVNRIFKAVEEKEKIVVHGDYDADGVTAATILISTLEAIGSKNNDVFLPHRETDGYGLNTNTIQNLSDEKTNLIITCDCGISNVKEVELANELGIDVIITDHHSVPEQPPEAFAIIHPKVDDNYPCKTLAGGAVAFKLMQGILRKHKEKNEALANGQTHEQFEKWLLDMVAIASVADMVPLVGESRTLTKYGLIVLNRTKRIGLQKLLLQAGLTDKKREIDAHTIGFQIAPRINAAGRINHANVAYNLMMAQDDANATDLARELDENNKERQNITETLLKEATKQIEPDQKDNPILFALGKEWSTGLVGLIAGRLKERYYKPSIVMAENNGEITGSGRSVDGFNIIECFQEMPEQFTKFGGHPMACGFTLASGKLESFKEKLTQKLIEKTKDKDLTPTLDIDAQISLENVDWDLYDILDKFKPFGQMNEKPRYLARNVKIKNVQPLGKDKKHIKIFLENAQKTLIAIGWNLCGTNQTNWCEELNQDDVIDIVFEIDVNEWNGNRELQLMIVDLRLSS
ncbi:single-stranded-DNA-specific exonuclease RecJ [Candidatus Parcubacteria bacterium]|nr:MAG: single-stranded-DNA-specific exonuclease RecJ [Candidatus Parcubacteria bacterium]